MSLTSFYSKPKLRLILTPITHKPNGSGWRIVVPKCQYFHFVSRNVGMTGVSKILRTLIMGPPGSGKGTISDRIVKDFGMKHLSSGDLLRTHISDKTALGLQAESFIAKGQLVPDNIMVKLIGTRLVKLKGSNWLLDGFPRTLPQAKALYQIEPIDIVINLDVPFSVIISRIAGRWVHIRSGRIYNTEFNPPKVPGKDDVTGEPLTQRDDDKPEAVSARLTTYQELTQPVLEFYRSKGLLEEFVGEYSNEIWPRVHKYMSTKTTPLTYTEYK